MRHLTLVDAAIILSANEKIEYPHGISLLERFKGQIEGDNDEKVSLDRMVYVC
jgi:hypothetical protein